MSGIFTQVGMAKEKATGFATTAGTGTAGVPNYATLTKTAHGLVPGDVVVITASTVAGYNGTWTVATVPSADTFTFYTGTVLLASATATFPFVTPSKYGTSVTPSKFFEVNTETLKADMGRIESKSIAVNNRVQSASRFGVYTKGITGDVELEVQSKGTLGWFGEAMFGKLTTTADTPVVGAHTHAYAIDSVRGKSFTIQKLLSKGEYDSGGAGTTTPGTVVTFNGCKVKSWSISCAADGILMLKLSFMGRAQDQTIPLAVASYAASSELFTFVNGAITIATKTVAVLSQFSLDCDLKLAERRPVTSGGLQNEPLEAGQREFKLSGTVEFVDEVLYGKYISATAAGSLAAVVITFTSSSYITGSTPATITITIPNWRIDGEPPTITGPDLLKFAASGPCLNNTNLTTQDAVAMTVVSGDANQT